MAFGYKDVGTEDHELGEHREALEHARRNSDRIKLHAGFLPWPYARKVLQEGTDKAIKWAKSRDYIPPNETLTDSEAHYSFFESLITGRKSGPPSDSFRSMFPTKLIRDASMAHAINKLIPELKSDDKILVMCGTQHMSYGFGIP